MNMGDKLYAAAEWIGFDTPEGRLMVAIADHDVETPEPPPIEEDPVAIRLGLVPDRCPLPKREDQQ